MKPGRYRHYKGCDYIVLGVARHSETEDELVVYRQDYGERSLWVRPKDMFEEIVNIDGTSQPRFRFIESLDPKLHTPELEINDQDQAEQSY